MHSTDNAKDSAAFDPYAKEQALRNESASWDTSAPELATAEDIPVIDLDAYFTDPGDKALGEASAQLRSACEEVGFFTIVGHQVPSQLIADTFEMVRRFHQLPLETKKTILMDRSDWPVGGIGYLPINNRKLPARNTGNLNEAFIIKRDHTLDFDDNQWPPEQALTGFRAVVESYARAMEKLGKRMLPLFATALDMPADFFDEAFINPLYRLRMTHYPPMQAQPDDQFGIAPHVDTTFCTILAQDSPGLTIYSERRQKWIQAPLLRDAFIVNSGELLRQWTNDRFLSVKHFANNNVSEHSRYSIPFFLNANANYPMTCVPSCCNEDNPAKYPPISYAESQAVAQGE